MAARLIPEAERGKANLKGDGDCGIVAAFLLMVSGVKFTCLALLERSGPGVVGNGGSTFSKFSLLGLLTSEGIDEGAAEVFLFELGYLRMDLTRSSLPGLRKKFLDWDRGTLPMLLIVADLVTPPGVPPKLGLDGDLDKVGIRVAGFLTDAARARDAWVGVVMDVSRLDCVRETIGVDGMAFGVWLPRETGLAEDVSSAMFCRARLAGTVFPSRSVLVAIVVFGTLSSSSRSSNFAFDCDRFKLGFAGVNRPGWARKAEG